MAMKSLKKHTHHLDKKLQRRLYLYFGISVILLGILVFNILRGTLRLDYGILGLLTGVGIGIITSRMFHTSWNKDAKKIVSRLDTFGGGILLLYIVFEILKEPIVGYFTHGTQVGTVGFAILAGIMFGRVVGTRGKIIEILEERNII
jgi:hypothetical protein